MNSDDVTSQHNPRSPENHEINLPGKKRAPWVPIRRKLEEKVPSKGLQDPHDLFNSDRALIGLLLVETRDKLHQFRRFSRSKDRKQVDLLWIYCINIGK